MSGDSLYRKWSLVELISSWELRFGAKKIMEFVAVAEMIA